MILADAKKIIEWKMVQEVSRHEGTTKEIAKDLGVPLAFVYKAKKIVSVWSGYPEEILREVGVDRAFHAARLAEKIGKPKAFAELKANSSTVLRELAKDPNKEPRLELARVPKSLASKWSGERERWTLAYMRLFSLEMSHDRFWETIAELLSQLPESTVENVLQTLWGQDD